MADAETGKLDRSPGLGTIEATILVEQDEMLSSSHRHINTLFSPASTCACVFSCLLDSTQAQIQSEQSERQQQQQLMRAARRSLEAGFR